MSDVTQVLEAIEQGAPRAGDELLPQACADLRRLAELKMFREARGQTMQATTLVLTRGRAAAEGLLSQEPERAVARHSQVMANWFRDLRTMQQFCRSEHRRPDSEFWRRRSRLTPDGTPQRGPRS